MKSFKKLKPFYLDNQSQHSTFLSCFPLNLNGGKFEQVPIINILTVTPLNSVGLGLLVA